ncbi:villin-1 isoform X2 [Populus alba x Populus x berolinensis]|uniref:Villin-1 isoform X2 n=1 Tax=Populus alba x Populus x berolinensis TaxID=444605 RepID=A0AAD6QA57_9ROSI|nr:villin-1 isoform X2 [Populus alba x Populus x berolinensis]
MSKQIDSVFDGAGAKPGLEIWCVEKQLRLVPVPKSLHGKFYSGNSYVVLSTVLPRSGPPQHDIHYWLGKDANEVESTLASDKALELDSALGSCTVQYREVQGQETEKFLSYFKPCVIPIEGVFSSDSGQLNGESYKISLLTCKGEHVVSVREVPFSRSSLNHNDVFILDTASKIFLFSGCNSSTQERAKALEVVQYIKENKHGGTCEVATVEDGKLVGDPEVGEFWSFFGGYAPIPRDSPCVEKQSDSPFSQLFWITAQAKLCPCEGSSLNKEMLETNKCYMLDCGAEIFVWMGRNTSITERKKSISVTEDLLRNQGRSMATHLTFLTEGLETSIFRSYFNNWPQVVEPKLYEEGRGKVAAIFKQQGYDVKELPDEEDCQPYINCRGKLKVWRINGDQLTLIPDPEQTKLFSGDCYIVQYTYPGNGRDEYLFYAWLGRDSVPDDRADAISHMNAIADSSKRDPVLVQVIQDKEPLLFFSIFQTVIIFKGGLSKRYKNLIAEKGILDETYDEQKTALFRVQGISPENMQAIQVDQVSNSLNSSYCYILQTGTSIFTWIGNLSSTVDHALLDRMLELINPTWQPISVREGSEPDIFWNALGGKTEYPRQKELKQHVEDPHLFTLTCVDGMQNTLSNFIHSRDDVLCLGSELLQVLIAVKFFLMVGIGSYAAWLNFVAGDFKVKEIYNFAQDDLTTEDVLILDCHEEIHVWIGSHSNIKSKQQAILLGMKFLQADPLVEGLSSETPIYVITEGREPLFFTRFFEWDSSKANMHGNSFERRLAILKGKKQNLEVHTSKSWKASSKETTPDSLRSKSVSSNGRNSTSPVSSASVTHFNSPTNYQISTPAPTARKLFPGSPFHDSAGSPKAEAESPSQAAVLAQVDGNDASENSVIYPYERLKVNSSDPVTDIDVTKREVYLCDDEFREKFGMRRKAFYELPKWRQNKLKISLHLF